jgi:hypothetical protein
MRSAEFLGSNTCVGRVDRHFRLFQCIWEIRYPENKNQGFAVYHYSPIKITINSITNEYLPR